MHRQHPTPVAFAMGTLLVFLAATLFAAPASAAAVDLLWAYRPGEDTSCRQWDEHGQVQWNLTLAMNGTDASLITTPTYVYVDDSTIQGPRADGWTFILVATNAGSNPKSFDDTSSNTFATDTYAYNPPVATGTMDLALYSNSHAPPAPPSNVTLFLIPRIESENKTWHFNLTARTHRTGVSPDVVKKIQLCVIIPADPNFEMGNGTDPANPILAPIPTAANSTVKVDFWIKNSGNTQDLFICNVTVPREDWIWRFEKGFIYAGGQNITNMTALRQVIPVTVSVYVPQAAKAKENSTVSLNCLSYKALTLNETLFVYPPYVKIEVVQFYHICGTPVGETSKEGVPGDQLRFDFKAQNLGNGPDDGTAWIALGNLSWQTVVTPEAFTLPAYLDPGWEEPAQFVITIPNNTAVGSYGYTLHVTTNVPGKPICPMRYTVVVKQVYIPIASQPPSQTGEPGQQILFAFTIKNGGNFDDEYNIDQIVIPEWRVFLDPPIGRKLLKAGEEAGFTATVIPVNSTVKAQVGTYSNIIRITSNYAREDIGQTISVEVALTVVILPKVRCAVDPPTTEKELNPFSFPGGIAKANFLLEVTNTGNGGDSVTLTSSGPELVIVTLSPRTLQLSVLEIKAVLVSFEVPSSITTGEYVVTVVAQSQTSLGATCTATYRITIFHLDGRLNPTMQAALQDPEHREAEIPNPAPITGSVEQVEGNIVKLRVALENRGDRAIGEGTAVVEVYDFFDCPHAPIRATEDTCAPEGRLLHTWSLPNNLVVNFSVFVEYLYIAPKWLCFEEALCEANPPQPNPHRIRFVLRLGDEADTSSNTAETTVNVLPTRVVQGQAASAPLPIIPIAAGLAVVGLAGFFVWWNYLRTPKVDEDLYASIYGGKGAGAQGPEPPPVAQVAPAPQVQQMTDAQLEEARRMYGDDYGRK